ncbi:hypothetical protein Athai_64300 [Actinocatenispora thailandica]|uniref:LppX_LprAFG lipoprotein n=1 Tax=Actinocatenispora thailandica TaxID=227318 RepID=A0A7R7DX01_9ACTN|nr:hypothetical protein [Actinocatenispora thailandica]BCJ38927.1 hypothetical protein Athai_64300 [Actinocatenispora thailandica]
MRRMIAAIAVCTAGLLLAGCRGSGAPSAQPSGSVGATSATPSAGPAQTRRATAELTQAVRKLEATSFAFDGGSGIARVTGSYQPKRHLGRLDGSFGIGAMDAVLVGTDLYVKGVDKDPAVWLRIRTTRLAPGNVLAQAIDPTLSTGYLTTIESAVRTSPGRYQGRIDLAELRARAAGDRTAQQLVTLLGPAPRRVTFEAAVDRSGRLTELAISVLHSASSAQTTVTTHYRDFGTPVRASAPPAAQVRDAPQQLYTVLAPNPTPPASSGTASPTAPSSG